MKSLRNAALAAMLFTAGVANATVYQFNLTGDYTASWQLDSSREPEEYLSGLYFTYYDNEGMFPGASEGIADVSFFYEVFGGGMSITDFAADVYLMIADGPQLFSGTEASLSLTSAPSHCPNTWGRAATRCRSRKPVRLRMCRLTPGSAASADHYCRHFLHFSQQTSSQFASGCLYARISAWNGSCMW